MDSSAAQLVLADDQVPDGQAALNVLVITDDAAGLIDFVTGVFGLAETTEARSPMPDGKLIHSEVPFGATRLMIVDRLEGWPARPGLLQVWVTDVAEALARGGEHGARTVTEPTPFYGQTTLGRMLDPWGNLWWLFAPAPGQPDPTPHWDGGPDTIFDTVDRALRALGDGAQP